MSFNPWKELWEEQQASQQTRHGFFWTGFLLGALVTLAGVGLTLRMLGVV